jgi:DNA-binding CsgD family transcriptional regulator
VEELSLSELKVVELIGCRGLTTEAAAKSLGRSHSSVRNTAQQVLAKTGARRLCQAVDMLMVAGKLHAVEDSPVKLEDEVEHRLACPDCGHITKVTHGEQIELLKRFDSRYPSQTITIECRCGRWQFTLQARAVQDASGGRGRFL